MALYAAIKPATIDFERYRKVDEYYEIYYLVRFLVDDFLNEKEAHQVAESAACWCETHFEGETYEHEHFTITLVED